MKIVRNVSIALATAGCVLNSACSHAGPKRIEATTASMRDTKSMLDRGSAQVTAVMAAVRSVESAQDRTRAFEDFSKTIERLDADAKDAQSAWASLTSRTDAYVTAWEAESAALSSEGSKQVAATRREAFAARVAALRSDLALVKSSYSDFATKVSDIRILLANDLTQGGLDAVEPFIAEAERSAAALQASIANLSAKLEVEMQSSSTAGPKPPATK